MQRREFIRGCILTFSGLMLSRNFTYADVKKETSRLFSTDAERGYDVVINSTSLAGAFAALSASQKGLRVLLVDVVHVLGGKWLKISIFRSIKMVLKIGEKT